MLFVNKEIWIIILVIIGAAKVSAQEATVASGGNASGAGGSVSYSIGQTTYSYITGTNTSASQGVQQPYEISTVTTTATAIKEVVGINLSCNAYPNPVTDILTLDVDGNIFQNNAHVTFHLNNISGSIIDNQEVTGSKTGISMENVASGLYILQVIQNNTIIKSFKIIKH
jgi:hypothetical protein